MKTKRRLLSLLMAGAVLFSTMPVNALAVGNPDPGGPCEHHREHTAECGYTEGAEGSPCTHEHTEDCYTLTTKCVHEHDEGCYPEDSVSDSNATPSNAEEREPENCPHVCSEESGCITKELDCQHEHDGDCGYIPASEGTPCTFVCGICTPADSGKEESGKTEDTELEDTIPENTETEAAEPEETETEATNLCAHHKEHTEDCGFVPATEDSEGSPCTYECRICPIEDLIAALPDEVTADNAEDVRARLDEILALYTELDEEEQEQINLSRCYALQEALDEANTPMPLVPGDFDLSQNKTVKLTAEDCGDNCLGHTITYKGTLPALGGATILVVSGNHNITFSGLNLTTAHVGVMPDATMNLTLTGENTIKAATGFAGIYVPVNATLIIGGDGSLNVSGDNGAGIGGTYYVPDGSSTLGDTSCGEVIINSGTIIASGGALCAGIGGITGDGSVPVGSGGIVIINGGKVTAKESITDWGNAPGIGGGKDAKNDGSLTLSSADVLAENTVLGPKGTYTINGDPTADMIVVPEGLVYSGKPLELDGKIYIDNTKTGKATYFNQEFTVKAGKDGWVLQDLGEVKEAKEYTAIFRNGDKEISKKFTVAQSGTQFEGNLIVRNGATETTAFTVSDTITVIATPKATGQAPANGAMLAASLDEPIGGQMALYVGDTQVSRAVDAVDGSYTMEASAADVLTLAQAAPGNIELTAKFFENGNMADAAGTVNITITAVAKVENGGAVTYTDSLEAAFAEANTGATVTLLTNVTLTEMLSIPFGTFTLDLNGKTIAAQGTVLNMSDYRTTLNIQDSSAGKTGTIQGGLSQIPYGGIELSAGTLNITGGTIQGSWSGVEINSIANTALNVSGDAVLKGTEGMGLFVDSRSSGNLRIQLSGGTFTGGQRAISVENGQTLKELLAEGCAYSNGDTLIVEGLELNGFMFKSVTVRKCDHTGEGVCEYVHVPDTATHSMTCLACGKVWDAEDCNYEYQSTGADEHTATCPKCGYVATEAHTLALSASREDFTLIVTAECSACNYTAEYSRGILESLGNLVYGKIGMAALGISFDLQSGVSPSYIIYRVDDDPTETMALSPDLSAGDHTLYAVMAFKDSSGKPVNLDPVSIPINVAKKPITATVTAENKTYDGNTGATVKAEVNSSDLVDNDSITITGVTGTFADGNAGTGKTVHIDSSAASVSGTGAENYAVSYPATVTADIAPVEVRLTFNNQEITYGEAPTPATADPAAAQISYSYTETAGTASGSGWPANAGTYTVTAKVAATGNYAEATASAVLTIKQKTVTPTVTLPSSSFTYTGSAQQPTVTVKDGNTVIPASEYTVEYSNDVNVGTATVTVKNKDGGNYVISETSVNFSITKANQAALTITGVPGSVTYGDEPFALGTRGGSGGGSVSWSVTGPATVDTNGKVSITGAGSITVKATKAEDNNYNSATAEITIVVHKKALSVTGAEAATRAYNGANTVTITGVTLSGKVKDTDVVSVDLSNLIGTINGTDAGDYASVTLPAMTLTGAAAGNYTLTHPTEAVSTSVEITKATAPAAQDGKMLVSIGLKHTYNYTLDQLLPVLTGGQTFGTVAYTLGTVSLGNYYTDGAAITGNKLSLPVNAVQSDKEEMVGTIPITISSKNFQDITAEITVSSVKQIVPEGTPTASPSTITYGQPISSITISGQMHNGADLVEGKFEWDSPNVIPDAGKYQAPWTFKPDNSGLYTEVTGYITITVQKATPSLTLTPSSATMPDGGTVTLTLSGLPAGGSADVTCSNDTISVTKESGDTWTADLPAGGGSYTFTASYAGDGNHTGATATCTVSVEKIKPALVLSASPKSLNGGGEVMLALTGLPDKGEATVSCSDSSITVTRSGENWKASLPNKTAEYTFTANYSGDAQHTSAEAACTVSVTQHTSGGNGGSSGGNTGDGNNGGDSGSNSGGGNSGSGSGGSTIITRPDEKHPDIPTTSETKPVKPDKDGNVSIGGDPIQDAINKATTDANKTGNKENGIAVTVPVENKTDAESLSVTLPAGTLDQLIAAKVRRLDITTNGLPCFSFTLDALKMFDSLPDGGNIILRLSKTTALSKQAKEAVGTRPVYDFSFVFVKDGKETPITDWKGQTVSVRMPYTPAKDEQAGNIYAVYVDADGKVEWLTKSSYDADQKALIFEASHFSIYGVGYKNPAPVFTDITGHWAADNIIFVASRGLLAGTGNNQFSPDTGMTRGMFVTALGRLAGIDPESYKTGKFTDVKANAYYAPYVNWAAEKGIVSGTSATTFSPDTNITREQMAVIMANYAKKMGYDLPVAHEAVTFADNAQISSWAAKEVKAMQQAGIMAGKGGNRFDPKGTATRAEVATVLRRFVEIVIDPQAAQGWMQDHSGSWQYMKDGKAVTGWLYDDKKWYWLDKDGKMFAGGFKMIDGKWYYFHTDGTMAANTTIDGYTIGPDGARK